jgi:enoyl-CoA hydratase
MDYQTITFEVSDGVAVLTLNRPKAGNAFNVQMGSEVASALEEVNNNPEIKVLVTTGAGEKFFCGGGDMQMLVDCTSAANAVDTFKEAGKFIPALYTLKKPAIAAVNGVASGAGTSLALAHDFILASENARFGANFNTIAFTPDSGASYLLHHSLNKQRMAELVYTGNVIGAKEALEWGIFNHVYPAESFMAEVMKMAKKIANNAPIAMMYDKTLIREVPKNDFFTQLELESFFNGICWSTEDFKEGVKCAMALMRGERIKPNFQGK